MSENEKKLNILKKENPFTSSSVGDPWEDKYPDVRSINERPFTEISQLIDQKIKMPVLPCAGLVFGEVGSGKTHLVTRILKHGKQADFPFSFAYVQPIEDTEQTYRYLLREVIVNLCYPISSCSGVTQLDIILGKICKEAVEKSSHPQRRDMEMGISAFRELGIQEIRNLRGELRRHSSVPRAISSSIRNLRKIVRHIMRRNAPEQIGKKAMDLMRAKFPDIPKTFLKVLFQYQIPEKRSAVTDWLKGVPIDDEDAALLGVSDRMKDSPALLEQKSRNILTYLGVLLVYYGQPLVICFDRLENYDTEEKIRSLGKMVEFLVDRAKAMLPLVFVRGQQWEEKFTKKLNQQVITRLRTNEFQLKGCDSAQALEIIGTRLALAYERLKPGTRKSGVHKADDFFPYDKEKLTTIFKARLHSPRQVIMLANQRLKQILHPEKKLAQPVFPLDKLWDEFHHQHKLIQADFDRYPADRSRLRRALELYLSHPSQDSFDIESLSHPDDKYVDFECRLRPGRTSKVTDAIFVIDNELNNSYVRASIKRGIDFLEKDSLGKAVYIRDARCAIPPPPKWKATNDMLDHFKELGGRVILLGNGHATEWYALALLNYAVNEGDVTVGDANGHTRPVSPQELATFVRERIHNSKTYSGFQRIGEFLAE